MNIYARKFSQPHPPLTEYAPTTTTKWLVGRFRKFGMQYGFVGSTRGFTDLAKNQFTHQFTQKPGYRGRE